MSFIQFQFRRGLASAWTSSNPVLADGELAIEKDTRQFKIGDGANTWSQLSYGGIVGPKGTLYPNVDFDVSFNANIFVGKDVSFSGRLFLNSDASFNSNLVVGKSLILKPSSVAAGGSSGSPVSVFAVANSIDLNGADGTNYFTLSNTGAVVGQQITIVSRTAGSAGLYLNAASSFLFNGASVTQVRFSNIGQSLSLSFNGTIWSVVAWSGVNFQSASINFGTYGSGDINISPAGNFVVSGSTLFNGSVVSSADSSFNSNVFIGKDLSLAGRLNLVKDASFNSNLFVGKDLSLAGRLSAIGDTSLNSKLIVGGDASLNGRLATIGDVSLNSNLFVGKDLSLAGRLNLVSDASFNANLFVGKDLSLAGRLAAVGDVSLNAKFNVAGDVSFGSNMFIVGRAGFGGASVTNTSYAVNVGGNINLSGNIYQNGVLFSGGGGGGVDYNADFSLNANLSVGRDISVNGNIYANKIRMQPTIIPSVPFSAEYIYNFENSIVNSSSVAGPALTVANNGATFTTPSKIGYYSLTLNGSSQYVTLSSYQFTNNGFSIAFWLKTSTTSLSTFFDFYNSTGNRIQISTSNGGQISFVVNGTYTSTTNIALNDGVWRHFAFTLSYTAGATAVATTYINGSLQTTSSATFAYPGLSADKTVFIGCAQGPGQFTAGFIDQLVIANRVIGSSGINTLYSFVPSAVLDTSIGNSNLQINSFVGNIVSYGNLNNGSVPYNGILNLVSVRNPVSLSDRVPIITFKQNGSSGLSWDNGMTVAMGGGSNSQSTSTDILLSYADGANNYAQARVLSLVSKSATSGNVGINNSTPAYELDVSGNVKANMHVFNENNYPYVIYNGSTSTALTMNLSNINTTVNSIGYFIFTNLIEDGLNNFNTADGTFTASLKGLYKFETTLVCVNNGGNGDDSASWGYTLVQNSVTTTRYITDNPEYWSRNGPDVEYVMRFNIIASLNVGDTVKVTGSGFNSVQNYIPSSCYFIAYLISAFS